MEKLYREYFIIIISVNQNKDDGMGKALLVIDMQKGFRHKPSEAILDNIIKLVKGFDGKVIFTLFVDVPNSMFETELNWPKFQSEEAQRLFKELEPIAEGKLEVKHNGYTVLTDELRDILRKIILILFTYPEYILMYVWLKQQWIYLMKVLRQRL